MTTPLRPPGTLELEAWLVAREHALQSTAHLLTGDVHAAQDLVQTTLATLYLHPRHLGGERRTPAGRRPPPADDPAFRCDAVT